MWQHFQQHQLVPKPVAPQQKDDVSIVESPLMSAKGLEKFVRYIQGLLYRKPRFNEFLGKQAKCSLYRRVVDD